MKLVRYCHSYMSGYEKTRLEKHINSCLHCQSVIEKDRWLNDSLMAQPAASVVPVSQIMSRVEKFSRADKLSYRMETIYRTAKRAALPIVIIAMVVFFSFPQLLNPFVQGVRSLVGNKASTLMSSNEFPIELFILQAPPVENSDLINLLNEQGTGVAPLEMLYADKEKQIFRNYASLVCVSGGRMYRIADLQALGLDHIQGSMITEFSFSPDGNYVLIGNRIMEHDSGGVKGGIYLFDTKTGRYTQLENGLNNDWISSWSFNGEWLVMAKTPSYRKSTDVPAFSVWLYNLESKSGKQVADLDSLPSAIFVSNDGDLAAYSKADDLHTYDSEIFLLENALTTWYKAVKNYVPLYIDAKNTVTWYLENASLKCEYFRYKEYYGFGATYPLIDGKNNSAQNTNQTITKVYRKDKFLVCFTDQNAVAVMDLEHKILHFHDVKQPIEGSGVSLSPDGSQIFLEANGSIVMGDGETPGFIKSYNATELNNYIYRAQWLNNNTLVNIRLIGDSQHAGEFEVITIAIDSGDIKTVYRSVEHPLNWGTDEAPQ